MMDKEKEIEIEIVNEILSNIPVKHWVNSRSKDFKDCRVSLVGGNGTFPSHLEINRRNFYNPIISSFELEVWKMEKELSKQNEADNLNEIRNKICNK